MYMQENKPRHPLSGQKDAIMLRLKLTGPGRGQVEQLWSDLDLCPKGGHSIKEGEVVDDVGPGWLCAMTTIVFYWFPTMLRKTPLPFPIQVFLSLLGILKSCV